MGKTKTIPTTTDDNAKISLAVYSCSNFPFGFFNAYGNPVRKNSVDYVLHLGDYIYEYGNGEYGDGAPINRVPLPNRTIFTLYDYRKRHATYRTDKDLLLSHQSLPWIPVCKSWQALSFHAPCLIVQGTITRSPTTPTGTLPPSSTTPKLPSSRMAVSLSISAK